MTERKNPATRTNMSTRRQMIGGLAIAIGGLAAGSEVLGKTRPQTMTEHPSTGANQKRTFLHQEITFAANP
jgi:hypothetical protein